MSDAPEIDLAYKERPGRKNLADSPEDRLDQTYGKEFYVRIRPKVVLFCAVYDGGGVDGVPTSAFCGHYGRRVEASASLDEEGEVVICHAKVYSSRCLNGNIGDHAPTLGNGQRVSVGPFRCRIRRSSVVCVVRSSGDGFVFGPTIARGVGKAKVSHVHRVSRLPAMDDPASFLSPDRKVWCLLSEGGEAQCGTYPEPPTRSAELHSDGHVSLCEVLSVEYPNGSHIPAGCFQNWPLPGDHVPVLRYGERSEVAGASCTSAADGITCIKVSGAGEGRGFRVSTDEAVEVEG